MLPDPGRRDLLQSAAALPLLGVARGDAPARADGGDAAGAGPPGLIVRESEPLNLESPFAALDGAATPNERFFVRNHFPIPEIDAASWRLRVEGAVERPAELGLDALRRMPARTGAATLECAGNGRVFLVPKAHGLLWETGAVGNAEWTGVPLAAVLDRAGVRGDAVEVVLEGLDEGEVKDEPKSPGPIRFARSLPLSKARRDVLLAYRMNGRDLTPAHGSPLRAVVPGWYGMASVKWLGRVLVVERPFAGYFQTLDYSYFERLHGAPSLTALSEVAVKAQIARPARREVVRRGEAYRVHGAAWSGEADVTKVELTADGGRTWSEAALVGEPVRHAWRLWEWRWEVPDRPGPATLAARATDSRGRAQPTARDPDRRDVMINHVVPVEVAIV